MVWVEESERREGERWRQIPMVAGHDVSELLRPFGTDDGKRSGSQLLND